ncbi:L,D-transpeptidase [Streptomyces abyssomicinicus]|uniref:L,D-transpeptidase n=1 Tax=Streptomyces abyssomicinicus TaxID=574929 RepID=UPI00125083D8|nr:Ig-like domain-containing protein [Streptomyces abyssomicinicus]
MSHHTTARTRPRTAAGVLLASALAATTAACGSSEQPLAAPEAYQAANGIALKGPIGNGRKADPDKPLEVTAEAFDGRITDVTAVDATGRYLAGELSADGRRWHSTTPLAGNARYTVRVSTVDEDGAAGRKVLNFATGKPTAKHVLDVKFGPRAGTYGVGQPVTAELSVPVRGHAQRAVVERALRVESTPAVAGSWHWVDDKELHFRPEEFWPAHATVRVRSNLEGIKVGDRLWGGRSRAVELTIGDKVVALTDAGSHRMTVYKNGEEVRTLPVTTGKPGFDTRNGVKVVLAKERFVRMRGTSIGIAEGSAESYDLPVHFATRVTWSGEYVHAAPWSVGSQGVANVSHGCTGMSTENAEWFFDYVKEGDVVEVVNSDGDMMESFGNGFGDWNMDWKKWQAGSALTGGAGGPTAADRARLTPQSL